MKRPQDNKQGVKGSMRKICLGLLVSAVLTGCGGGGGSSSSSTPTSPTQPESRWQAGVFEPSTDFDGQCEVVRTHLNIFGEAYPDVQGTEEDEKLWLRSWSHETYLWYDEITDVNPANFASPQSYFEVLKTTQTTASGALKDNFHFYESTDDFEAFSQSGSQTGYGINWSFIASAPPRDIRVTSVEGSSSAGFEGVARGDKLIRINDEDVIDGDNVDFLNNALFPAEENSQFSFTFERVDGSEVTFNLTSGVFEESFVNNVQILQTDTGTAGYMRFDGFQRPAQTPLIEGFQRFADENVTDLILDLRYNGGGLLAMSSQLAYMIAGEQNTAGSVFEVLQYNDKFPSSATPFYTEEIDWERGVLTDNKLPTLDLERVFVIATGSTCSASESLMNGLRGIDVEVIQIGGTTCGKPYGFVPTDNCGTTYYTIQFQGVNDKGFGDYADGFKPRVAPRFDDELPGCEVADDFEHSLGDTSEGMLAATLERLNTGSCPVNASGVAVRSLDLNGLVDSQSELSVYDPRGIALAENNRIYIAIEDSNDE
ncbi:peptidase S41 [Neiella marina]|uniref:Peptidase S41 n=1 Tax=Neiella marina TaxID=508461 RepID=A0A8J2U4R2_9GAMM|nr:S41 family peptidase [Neiella marina]GGA75915.1 peptidase S41 [Neiella marina]